MDENNLNNVENNENLETNESQEPETNLENENVSPEQPIKNEPQEKEKSNLYWIIYIVAAIVIFIIIILLLKGCNALKNKGNNKIVEANDWVTNVWNKCVDPIYWYTVEGTGVSGAAINIDSVLKDCDTYYNEYTKRKSEITSLSDEYKDFKDAYAKISEQIEIIYPKIKANKPVAEEEVDYEENMETFYKYQVELYNLVKEKYSKG